MTAAPLSARLANSSLTDKELLIISDVLYMAQEYNGPNKEKAIGYITRHKDSVNLLSLATGDALNLRGIDFKTGTKKVVTVVDLLA